MDILKKKLFHRSKFRGCKETDILLGNFAEDYLADMSASDVGVYEDLLAEDDSDIYKWVNGQLPPPDKYASFCAKMGK
jgi:succinate dehydrogenase flavin-adding protein (antitoxin of CptAB toxin-antitoxin module)